MKKLVSLLFISLVSFSLQAEFCSMRKGQAVRAAHQVLEYLDVRPGGVVLGDAGYPVIMGLMSEAEMQDMNQFLYSIVQELIDLKEEINQLKQGL